MLKHLLATTALLLPMAALAQGQEGPRFATPIDGIAAVSGATIEPNVIAPGGTVRLRYNLAFSDADTGSRPSAQLVGLPGNSVAAGTPIGLDVPLGQLAYGGTDITVRAPARAGTYPLAIRLQTQNGTVTTTPIGSLTIIDVPGRIDSAQWVPVAGGGQCVGGSMPAAIRYTVTDPNGADDVERVAISSITPLQPAPLATVLPAPRWVVRDQYGNIVATETAPVAMPAPAPALMPQTTQGLIVTEQPGGFTVTQPTTIVVAPTAPGPVVMQSAAGQAMLLQSTGPATMTLTAPMLPMGGLPLALPRSGSGVTESVVSSLQMPCLGGYPGAWRVDLTAVDTDGVSGSPRQMQTVAVTQ